MRLTNFVSLEPVKKRDNISKDFLRGENCASLGSISPGKPLVDEVNMFLLLVMQIMTLGLHGMASYTQIIHLNMLGTVKEMLGARD